MWWHVENGFFFSRPDYLVMGRPVVREADPALIVGLHRFPSAVCNCWHIYLAAGNLARAWSVLPWPLEWISWERANVLRFHRLASIQRLSGIRPTL